MNDESSSHSMGSKDGDPQSFISRMKRRLFKRQLEGTLRENIEEMLEEHPEGGLEGIGSEERLFLMNTLDFADMRVENVMTPRTDVIAVDETLSLSELIQAFAEAEVSRMPVYRGTLDNVIGLVHLKDLFLVLAKAHGASGSLAIPENVTLISLMRPILHVSSSMRLSNLLLRMRARRVHMAVVVDEYGGVDGLVTNEDLIEQIVGEIEDEHDTDDESETLEQVEDRAYEAGGRVTIEHLENVLGLSLRAEGIDDVDTVGGLVVAIAGRVPRKGETVILVDRVQFDVLESDSRRLRKLRVTLMDELVQEQPE